MSNPPLRHPEDQMPAKNRERPPVTPKESGLQPVYEKAEAIALHSVAETVGDALRRLHIRIGQLNTRGPSSPVLKRLTMALVALDTGMTRLGRRESRLSDISALAGLFQNIDDLCAMLESPATREEPASPSPASDILRETKVDEAHHFEMRFDHIDQCLTQTAARLSDIGQEQRVLRTDLTGQLAALRDNQKAEGRKLVASMGAIYAALELCVSRLSGLERAVNESDRDHAPHPLRSGTTGHATSEPALNPMDSEVRIDPRSALAAARAAASRALYRDNPSLTLAPSTLT